MLRRTETQFDQFESAALQGLLKSSRSEVNQVARYIEMQPTGPCKSRLPAGEVRHVGDQAAAGREPPGALPKQRHRLPDVLEHLKHDDQIETQIDRKLVNRGGDNFQPEGAA